MYALSQDYSIEAAGVGSFWMPLWERSSISELGGGGRVISISQRVRYLPGLFGYDQTLGEATDALRGALGDRFRDSSDPIVGSLVSALGSLNLSAAQFRHVADHPDIYGPEIVAVMGQASEENQQYIGYLANTMRYYGRNAGRDYAYGKLASAGLAWGVGGVGGAKKIAALTNEAKDALRTSAREIWYTRTGRRAIWDGMDVHHRIPLEWSHIFPYADANRAANLIGMRSSDHTLVTNAWNAWRQKLNGRIPNQAEVLRQALRIDEQFGKLMKFLP